MFRVIFTANQFIWMYFRIFFQLESSFGLLLPRRLMNLVAHEPFQIEFGLGKTEIFPYIQVCTYWLFSNRQYRRKLYFQHYLSEYQHEGELQNPVSISNSPWFDSSLHQLWKTCHCYVLTTIFQIKVAESLDKIRKRVFNELIYGERYV